MPLELASFSTRIGFMPSGHRVLAMFLILACICGTAWAQSASFSQAAQTGQSSDAGFDSAPAREVPKKSQTLTLAQAIKHVRHATPGKILSARRIQTSQGPAYRIKVLTRTGLVRVVQVAESVAPKPEPKGE